MPHALLEQDWSPARVPAVSGYLEIDATDSPVQPDDDEELGAASATRGRRWLLRAKAAALVLSTAALAVAAARGALPRDGGRIERFREGGVELKAAGAADEAFSCLKYGCLDVRTMNGCQCSHWCEEEGGCCPDYQATCKNPARTAAALGHWGGCPQGVPGLPAVQAYAAAGPALRVKVLSYNPEWWHTIEQMGGNGNRAAQLIATAGYEVPFDLIGFQEFYDPWFGLTRPGYNAMALLQEYIFIRGEVGGPVGTIIGFRNSTWSLVSKGQQFVAEDRQGPMYFGKRIALWARLWHRETGKTVFFMNHHGPLPTNTGGICGGGVTASNLLQMIATNASPQDAVILIGDFNANDAGPTIQQLGTRLHKNFHGIDNIFSNIDAAHTLCTGNLGNGGSDHDALNAIFELGQPAAAATDAVCTMPQQR